jgi:hypothetical protein
MKLLLSTLILLFASAVNADVDLKELRSYGNGSFIVSPKVPNTLFYFGNGQGSEIVSGDSLDLRKALRNEKVNKVVLYSNGGFLNEGLIMAGIIHDKGLTTVIPKGAVCLSACAYMLFGPIGADVRQAMPKRFSNNSLLWSNPILAMRKQSYVML